MPRMKTLSLDEMLLEHYKGIRPGIRLPGLP